MKTTINAKEFSEELVKHITIHNDYVLVCSEITVSDIELGALSSSTNTKTFANITQRLDVAPKVIVKVSDKVAISRPELKVFDAILKNPMDSPISIKNEKDVLDIENVIEDYNFDNKSKGQNQTYNTIGVQRRVRLYSLYSANFIPATITLD